MGNGFFINRSLEEYEMDLFMVRLEYLLKYREIQAQIANIWRKTSSKEKYQQERPFTAEPGLTGPVVHRELVKVT